MSAHIQSLHKAFNFAFNLALNYTIKIDLLNQYHIQALTKVFCTPLWKYAKWHHPQATLKIFDNLQLYDTSVLNHSFDTKKKALFFGMELHLKQVFLFIQKILFQFIHAFLGLRKIKTLTGLTRKGVETRNSIDATISPKIFSNTLYVNMVQQHQPQHTSQPSQRSHIPLVTKGKSQLDVAGRLPSRWIFLNFQKFKPT